MRNLLLAAAVAAVLAAAACAPVREIAQAVHAETTWSLLADLTPTAHADSDFWN